MQDIKIKTNHIISDNTLKKEYPKYTSQLINLINQNTQATRPKNVGQLTELFPEYAREKVDISIEGWNNWYKAEMGDTITPAVDKIMNALPAMKDAIEKIDRDLVVDYINSLIIDKTYEGLGKQYNIIKFIAAKHGLNFRIANSEEERQNIDGYINEKPVQIKSYTYKHMGPTTTVNSIECVVIYYKENKKDNELTFQYDENYFIK